MRITLALLALLALLLLVDTVAASSSKSKAARKKKAKALPPLRKVNHPSRKAVAAPLPAVGPKPIVVTGWAKRLTIPKSLTPLPSSNGVGFAPRFVSYGNYRLSNNSVGTPDPKTSIAGLTHYNLAFWVSNGGNSTTSAGDVYTGSGNAQEWAQAPALLQRAIVKEYNKNGVRLGVAVFGASDAPQENHNDPVALATTIAAFVKNNNLQGVDVDFEEYNALTDWSGSGAAWLIPFTRTLRSLLPRPRYYISHAPVAPLFNGDLFPNGFLSVHQQVGSLIDFYNVQFYNQRGAYSTCQTLLNQSDVYEGSSLFELINKWKVPANKIVIGKPAHVEDAITYAAANGKMMPDGYMTPKQEQACLLQARKQKWKGGAMWWQYKGLLQDVIRPARIALR